MPPLREREGDIPVLVRHFVQKISRRMDKKIETIPSAVNDALLKWRWPGNVRELENFIERSVILTEGSVLRAPLAELTPEESILGNIDVTLERAEREHILRVLRQCGGIVSGPRGAAAKLGVKRTTLQSKMRKLGIVRKDYAA
jgi:formate hydrogenlyase transcriptional activator